MKFDFFGAGGLTGDYAGPDGDIHIRLPLMLELIKRGHEVSWSGVEYTGDKIVNPWESILAKNKSAFLRDLSGIERGADGDVLYYELRPHPNSDPKIADRLKNEHAIGTQLIESYISRKKPILIRVTDNWLNSIQDYMGYGRMFFLTPFHGETDVQIPSGRRVYFPFFHHGKYFTTQYLKSQKMFLFMYLGNEWGRREFMGKILDKFNGLPIALSGNWLRPQTREFSLQYNACWLGKTNHWTTMPFLNQAQATFHIGHPGHLKMDFITQRLVEAYMANVPCFVYSKFPSATQFAPPDLLFSDENELFDKVQSIDLARGLLDQTELLYPMSVQRAANHLERLAH